MDGNLVPTPLGEQENKMHKNTGKSKASQIVAKIRENGFRCALSGWQISPQCFELDHIVSMNDGGTDDIANLQALHPLVNRAKGTMGNQQFIDMCKAVANFASGVSDVATAAELETVRKELQNSMVHPPAEVGSSSVNR